MRIWPVIILVLCVLFLNAQSNFHPQLKFNSITDRILHPFDQRLRYRIGQVAPQFNVSHSELILLAQQATDIWHLGTQKQYFVYDPNAQLSINLIYDQRQADSNARNSALNQIENSKYTYMQEQQKLNDLHHQLNQYKQKISSLEESYTTNVRMYNQWVASINHNQHMGNTSALARLEAHKNQLLTQQDSIQQEIDFFNLQVSELNRQVGLVNGMQNQLNHSVRHFNHHFKPRQFDKGLFNGREINIYEFSSNQDLKITLAHEFGHALGILHTNEPTSLMYPIMERQDLENFSLTSADLALLNQR